MNNIKMNPEKHPNNWRVDKLLEFNKLFLKFVGIYPPDYERHPQFSTLVFYFSIIVNVVFVILQLLGAWLIADTEILPEKQIMYIISETRKLEEIPPFNNEALEVMRFWKTHRNRVVKILTCCYLILTSSYFVAALLTKDQSLTFKLIFKPNTYYTPWYEIITALELLFFLFSLSSMIAADTICVIFVCQLCMELQIIEVMLKNIEKNNRFFVSVIEKHIRILKYGEDICEQLSSNLLSQYSLLFFIVCFASFTAQTTNVSALRNKMLWITTMVCFVLLTICVAGELLTSTSESVANTLSQCELIRYERDEDQLKVQKMFVFVLMRAQKPLKLSVGTVGILNLQFYSSTMKNVYSIIMLLKTVYS